MFDTIFKILSPIDSQKNYLRIYLKDFPTSPAICCCKNTELRILLKYLYNIWSIA